MTSVRGASLGSMKGNFSSGTGNFKESLSRRGGSRFEFLGDVDDVVEEAVSAREQWWGFSATGKNKKGGSTTEEPDALKQLHGDVMAFHKALKIGQFTDIENIPHQASQDKMEVESSEGVVVKKVDV
ncbi:hypothetical protein ACOSP7_009925 [Xanthoceras sorbifolium]